VGLHVVAVVPVGGGVCGRGRPGDQGRAAAGLRTDVALDATVRPLVFAADGDLTFAGPGQAGSRTC
jgi:hypothetical protein